MSEQSLNVNENSRENWPRTSWSRLDLLSVDQEDATEKVYEELISRYWPAVYSYIRKTGRSHDQASDLTQGFICDVVLGRQLFHAASRDRGRFRSLLLTALKNYIMERHRYETRVRRGGRAVLLSFDLVEQNTAPSRAATSPEQAFQIEWAGSLIRHVLDKCQQSCRDDGLSSHWEIFEARVVRPAMTGDLPLGYETLINRFGLPDVSQAANMMVTAKRRFARCLQDEISATVEEPMAAPLELDGLLLALEGRSS